MQQKETKIEMPEILVVHEPWGKKVLRALFPTTWWKRLLESIGLLVLASVINYLTGGKVLSPTAFCALVSAFYLIDAVTDFLKQYVATKKGRKTEKAVITGIHEHFKNRYND